MRKIKDYKRPNINKYRNADNEYTNIFDELIEHDDREIKFIDVLAELSTQIDRLTSAVRELQDINTWNDERIKQLEHKNRTIIGLGD